MAASGYPHSNIVGDVELSMTSLRSNVTKYTCFLTKKNIKLDLVSILNRTGNLYRSSRLTIAVIPIQTVCCFSTLDYNICNKQTIDLFILTLLRCILEFGSICATHRAKIEPSSKIHFKLIKRLNSQ